MGDNWITLIPEDPAHVPDEARRDRAKRRFAEIAPNADEITGDVTEPIEFFVSPESLERIHCPSCNSLLDMEWWKDRMDDDYAEGFKMAGYAMPCCKAKHTLQELAYHSPQGFGRFGLRAMNPNIGALSDQQLREFESILATPLRVIYQHL